MTLQTKKTDVAIIGMSALYPGAKDLATYWQNIINKTYSVSEGTDEWATPYYDPQSSDNDRIYTRKGGFLHDLAEFDPLEFGIMPNAVDGGEPDQYLALKLARDALDDAGYLKRSFNREKTGVILGRGTYINRGYTNLVQHGMIVDQTLSLLRDILPNIDNTMIKKLRHGLKSSLPGFNAEMAPGLVPNVVSGRIANRLDLMGPNYIIDAACASSLIATELAIDELHSGRCDMVITGGVHASTPPQINMVFCQLGGLSRGNIQPFAANASGTLLGEGLGILILKRVADAERDGDRIYAVVKGVGSSSDGKALGLLAPRLEGEVLALQRAYSHNGISPQSIGLIEAHGTGIPLGDQTEIRSLSTVFGAREATLPGCALGSVKSMIAHCLPAAGAAGMIKMALSLYHRVLPPTLCDQVNPEFELDKTPFYVNTECRPWIHGNRSTPRRAAVNAFGFGGVNAHAILEEYPQSKSDDQTQIFQQWPVELLLFSATRRCDLISFLTKVLALLKQQPQCSVSQLALSLSKKPSQRFRLAISVKDTADSQQKIAFAIAKLTDQSCKKINTRNGIHYSEVKLHGKVAFLFPGEGSQYPNMLADLCIYFPQVRRWFDLLDNAFQERDPEPPSAILFPAPNSINTDQAHYAESKLMNMELGSESVFIANMALNELINQFNIKSDVMLGHSTGENSALVAAGLVRFEDTTALIQSMRNLNDIYRHLAKSNTIARGALLAVAGLDSNLLQQVLENNKGQLYLAMDNCHQQKVLFGEPTLIDTVKQQLTDLGSICSLLPFDRAYHTPLFENVGKAFAKFYAGLTVEAGHTRLYSCATTSSFPDDAEGIRALVEQQWSSSVRFSETATQLYKEGVRTFIEIGPSGNLTGFVKDIFRSQPHMALSSNVKHQSGLQQLHTVLSKLWVNAVCDIDFSPLYRQRNISMLPLDFSENSISENKNTAINNKKVLNRTLPKLRLEPDLIRDIRSKLRSLSVTQSNETEKKVVTHDPLPLKQNVDIKQLALSKHLQLMQSFLESQNRVMSHHHNNNEQRLKATRHVADTAFFNQEWPLLGLILEKSDNTLLCQRHFDLEHDLFLRDHTLGGTPSQYHTTLRPLAVLPFTLSMEILAQAAAYLCDDKRVVTGISHLRGYRWLALDEGHIRLKIVAQRLKNTTTHHGHDTNQDTSEQIQVTLYELLPDKGNDSTKVFEGVVSLHHRLPSSSKPSISSLVNTKTSRWQDNELYQMGMFHGPRLQGVKHIRCWNQSGIEADLIVISNEHYFSHTKQPQFKTDFPLMDAAGQLLGFWLAEQHGENVNCFPFQLGSVNLYGPAPQPGSVLLCRAEIHFSSQTQLNANIEILNEMGHVIARLESWQDFYFTSPPRYSQSLLHPQDHYLSEPWLQSETGLICRRITAFPAQFFDDMGALRKRALAHVMLNQNERDFWYRLPENGNRRRDWLLGRIAAKDALRQWAMDCFNIHLAPSDFEILPNKLNKPCVRCTVLKHQDVMPNVSISHSNGYVVAITAPPPKHIGIDLEIFDKNRPDNALFAGFSSLEQTLLDTLPSEEKKVVITALWCAKEAAAKALGTGLKGNPRAWRIKHYSPDYQHVVIVHNNEIMPIRLWFADDHVFALCVMSSREAKRSSVVETAHQRNEHHPL